MTYSFDIILKLKFMKIKNTLKPRFLTISFMLITTIISAQWTPISNGLPALTTIGVANLRDTLFTAVKNHGVYYSVNNGDNWIAWKHNNKITNTNITKFEGLTVFPPNIEGNYFSLYGNSMFDFYFSQGGGAAFFNYNTPNEDINTSIKDDIEGIEYHFVGTNNGVYYSIDDKQTWIKSTGFTGDALIVNDLNITEYKDDSKAIFASTNKGIYKSTDKGATFTLFTNGIVENLKVYNQNFLVTTSNGVYFYRTDDDKYHLLAASGDYRTSVLEYQNLISYAFGNGSAIKIDLQTLVVENISQVNLTGGTINSVTHIKDFLFICTDNGGVFRINRETSLSVNDSKLNSISFSAFPNPSNGKFTLTTNQPAVFELYSIRGKLLKSLYVNTQESYDFKLASGIYFLRKKGTKIMKKIIFN